MSHNPFSPAYKSQLDLSDITRERKLSESRSASLEKRRQSDDPEIRRQPASINSQAKLQSDAPGKSAKLSRGKAI